MTNLQALHGYNRAASAVNKLFAAYGNDIIDVDTNTGYNQNLTPNKLGQFATYMDYDFYVNGNDATRSFNGTAWSKLGVVNRAPIAKYAMPFQAKLYLAYLTINSQVFPSSIWVSDLPYNNSVRWGLEYGSNLTQTAGSAVVTSDAAYFDQYGIKVGDKFTILTGVNAGDYSVYSIDSNNQITLTSSLRSSATNSSYIVGSNRIDVQTADNDYIRGLGENFDRLLVFKLFASYRYSGYTLEKIADIPGTSSYRSIVNNGATYFFHGSEPGKNGIYKISLTVNKKMSEAIQPYIDGIASSMYENVVAWSEGETVRFYVGTITNAQRNISVPNAVITMNVKSEAWSVDPIGKEITQSTTFLESSVNKVLIGTEAGEVFTTPSGYSYDGTPIAWAMETGVQYPVGSEVAVRLTRIQVISRDAKGIGVRFKLYNNPANVDDQWQPVGEIIGDKTELTIPTNHCRGAGINIRFEESGLRENTQYIEKVTVFYVVENSTFI